MFSGVWRESTENVIHIEVLDPNINLDCELHSVVLVTDIF